MSETKITKETKQEIAVNYAIEKVSKLREQLIEITNKVIKESRLATLRINNNNLDELENLITQVNKIKNKTIKNNFYSNTMHISKIGYLPLEVNSLKHNTPLPNPNRGTLFYYYGNLNLSNTLEHEQEIDIFNFNYSKFSKYSEDDLYQDSEFDIVTTKFNEVEKEYKESFNNAYVNCYELIRNIRTLERIKKKFPDVNKYLPEKIKIKENYKSIIEGFNDL